MGWKEWVVHRTFGKRLLAVQRPATVGNRVDRAPADAQSLGDLPLRQLPLLEQAIDCLDYNSRVHRAVLRFSKEYDQRLRTVASGGVSLRRE